MRKISIKIAGNLVTTTVNGVEYNISNTDTWVFDLEDTCSSIDGEYDYYIPDEQYKALRAESVRLFTEVPSIQNIAAETIIGQPTGCRVNGGGANRCLVTTLTNTYIVGANKILKRLCDGTWESAELTLPEDIEFCHVLDSNAGYEYCSGKFFSVVGCRMPQIKIVIK